MRYHWYYFPGYLWALPATIVGLLLVLIYRPKVWRWSDGCLEAITNKPMIGKPAAQTHGWLIYYRDDVVRSNPGLRVHERIHVLQGFVGGPLFMLAYVLHFLWLFAMTGFGDWKTAYMRIWAERQAFRAQREFNSGLRPGAWGGQRTR